MKEDKHIIEGFLIRENITDNQGDTFSAASLKNAMKDIKIGDNVYKEFLTHIPPIGKVLDVKYKEGEGIWIKAEIFDTKIFKFLEEHTWVLRPSGHVKSHETKDGIRIIKELELIECSLVPKFMDVYE